MASSEGHPSKKVLLVTASMQGRCGTEGKGQRLKSLED